jgi:hypothetical protein
VRRNVLIERDLIRPMPPPPESVPIPGLIHSDPVDPGAQAGLAAEAVDRPEHPQEDLLRQIESFVAIAQEVHRQLNHHPLVLGDQLGTGRLLGLGTLLHECRLTAANLGPTRDARLLH